MKKDNSNQADKGILNSKYAVLLQFIRSEFGSLQSANKTIQEAGNPEKIKKAVLDLIQENQKLADIFFNAPVGYAILDTNYMITEANVLACNLLKKNKVDLNGKLFSKFIDAGYHEAFQFFMKNLKAGKPNVHCELKLDNNKNLFRIIGVSGMEKAIENQSYRLVFFESSAYSDSGQQTEFSSDVAKNEREPVTNVFEINQPKDSSDEILENLTILAADDDEVTRFYLSELLEKKCRKMFFAKNGKEAVEIFETNPNIDLILMDIKMPVLDGYSATIKIKETDKKVIVIAQTAYALASDREKALAAGCNDYIAKPLMKKDLLSVIQKFFS